MTEPHAEASWASAETLGWPELVGRISARAVSAAARERILRLALADSLDEAERRVARVREAVALELADGAPPVTDLADAAQVLAALERGAVATVGDLCVLHAVLRAARDLRAFAAARRESHPALSAALDSDPALGELSAALDRSLEGGEISEGASTELAAARRALRDARARAVDELRHVARRHRDVLRAESHDVVDGRHVLFVRADAHHRVDGIVVGSSASGATLIVEPASVIPLSNRVKIVESDVAREELAVRTDLSSRARERAPECARAWSACLDADVVFAIARWALEADAHPITPEGEPVIDLRNARHPLLLGRGIDVVANDVRLDSPGCLVISGPNAGGKSVLLKTIGLFALMVRAGLPLPAGSASRVGWFDPVLANIGDQQAIERSLSTFSAHASQVAEMLARARARALVLLDELAGGTDPAEGAALATAVLEALVERGATVVVTTHHEPLKELALSTPRFRNASVGFDFGVMRPTFELHLDVPGPSSALLVAERYGIPAEVIARARVALGDDARRREDALAALDRERAALAEARATAERDASEQARLREEVQHERERARVEARTRLAEEAATLMTDVRAARSEIRAARERVKPRSPGADDVRRAEREVDAAARHVAVGTPLAAATRPAPPPVTGALERGATVWLRRMSTSAQVVDPPARGHLRVLVGAMKLVVALEDVSLQAPPARKKPKTRSRAPAGSNAAPGRTSENTLDLRGERVEEALLQLDGFLDRLLGEGEPAGFVLHGHGTGALKDAVRAHLAQSAYVERARAADADDGGDAFTVFWIAG